ncbi:MAG TPA: 5'-deoxynucleotidase [Candidatus Aphodomonas merdavium]|nr:5'-deoxynucleotidase [Candidatus Aphodomonas merdavium]
MHHFFAYMARMKQILRWGLMRNTRPENDQEHALQAAMIAHALATMRNVRRGGTLNAERIAALAMYHDAGEVITGDLATPIKHFNPQVRGAFEQMEQMARNKLLTMLPQDLRGAYAPLLLPDETAQEWRFVKAADRLCAYLKCVEEIRSGNGEFTKARDAIARDLEQIAAEGMPEVREFLEEFAKSFELTLDELN